MNHLISAEAVWDKKWSGVKLTGTAQYLKKGKWFDLIKQMPENKGLYRQSL